MVPATVLDGASLDLLAPFPDAITSPEVEVGGGEVVQALVIAAVIVMLDKVGNGPFEVAGQIVVFKQDETL